MCVCGRTKHEIHEAKTEKYEIHATHITLRIYDNKKKNKYIIQKILSGQWGFPNVRYFQ